MDRPSFDQIYMDFACNLAKRSTCSRLQVGCVIVTVDNHRVLSVGYNGGAKGVFNDCLSSEPGKCGHLHAEINSLIKFDYNDPARKKMYVTYNPCFACSVAIINADIDEVIYLNEYRDMSGVELLQKAHVNVRKFVG
jgi:dCMP deaminase